MPETVVRLYDLPDGSPSYRSAMSEDAGHRLHRDHLGRFPEVVAESLASG